MDHPTGVDLCRGKVRIRWQEGKRRPEQVLHHIPYTLAGLKTAAKLRRAKIQQYLAGFSDRGPVPTFGMLAKIRLETTVFAPESLRSNKLWLRNYWLPFFDMPVDDIQYSDLLQPFRTLLLNPKEGEESEFNKRPLKPKTVVNILSAGSAVFRLAIKSKWRTDNPALELLKEIEMPDKFIDPFTTEERDKILNSLKTNHRSPNRYLFYLIRFYCGLRPSEAIALTWSDYDQKNHEFIINKGTVRSVDRERTKTGVDRTVPVHPRVKALLQKTPRQLHDQHIITTKEGKGFRSADKLTKSLVRAMREQGIRYRNPYNARHTCATMMLEDGMEPAYCAERLGHSLEMFYKTYAKWTNADKSAAQAAIWARMK